MCNSLERHYFPLHICHLPACDLDLLIVNGFHSGRFTLSHLTRSLAPALDLRGNEYFFGISASPYGAYAEPSVGYDPNGRRCRGLDSLAYAWPSEWLDGTNTDAPLLIPPTQTKCEDNEYNQPVTLGQSVHPHRPNFNDS